MMGNRTLLVTTMFCGCCAMTPAWGDALCWEVIEPARLDFEAVQAGAPFMGRFEQFRATIRFDGGDLNSSLFDVQIDTASIDTDYQERDEILRGREFFFVAKYPTARYRASRFQRLEDGRFAASGSLAIRGQHREVRVTFSFSGAVTDPLRILTGQAILNRLDFGLGLGEWDNPKWLGHEVKVSFDLRLRPADCLHESAGGA